MQIALALANYQDTYGAYPRGAVPNPSLTPEERLSWLVHLLPFMEQQALYNEGFDYKLGWDAERNRTASRRVQKGFICPSQPMSTPIESWPRTSYIGIAGVGSDAPSLPLKDARCGVFGYERRTTLEDVKDGTSNTVCILETTMDNGRWASGGHATVRPVDSQQQPCFGQHRPFGMDHRRPFLGSLHFTSEGSLGNAAMLDGSVRTLNPSISPRTLEALATIAGGEEIASDF